MTLGRLPKVARIGYWAALLATTLACGEAPPPSAAPPAIELPRCTLELAQPLAACSQIPHHLAAGDHHCYRIDLPPGGYLRATVTQGQSFDLVWILSSADGQESVPFDAVADGIEPLHFYRPPTKSDLAPHATEPILLDLHELDAWGGNYELSVQIDPTPSQLLINRALAARAFAEADREYANSHEERWLGHMQDSLDRLAATGDPETEAALLYRLADLLQNNIPEKIPNLAARLIRLQDEYGTDRRRAGSRLMAAMKIGDPRSLPWAQRALEIAQSLDNRKLQAIAHQRLGALLWARGEPGTPEQHYEESSKLFQASGLPLNAAQTLITLGRWKTLYSDHDGAHRALDRAEKLIQSLALPTEDKTRHRVRNELLEARGNLAFVQKQWQAARNLFADLLRVVSSSHEGDLRASALDGLARAEAHLGASRAAERHFGQSIASWMQLEKPERANAVRVQRAYERYKRKQPERALRDYRELCPDGSEPRADLHPLTWASCRFGLGRIARDRADLAIALRRMEEALHQIEEYRGKADRIDQRQHLAAIRQHYYEEVIEVALRLSEPPTPNHHDLEYSFAVSERAHGRTLRDRLDAKNDASTASVSKPLGWLTLRQAQELAAEEGALILQYNMGPHQSHLWAISGEGTKIYALPGRSKLEALLTQFWKTIRDSHRPRKMRASQQAACNAAELLLRPVAHLLHGQPLWIIAQSDLDAFPFAALPIPSDGVANSCKLATPSEPTLLVERHLIVRPPSVSSLVWLHDWSNQRQASASKRLAVVAAPHYGGNSSYKPLAGAQEEAERLSALVPPEARLIITDEEAKASTVLTGVLAGYQYIDFATHAEVGNRQEYASLILSPDPAQGEAEESHLYAYQLARLKLSADLVSLAGCATGLGEKLRGESLQGLPQAFFATGVPRVLVSLWSVKDEPTAFLMERFFQALLTDHLSPAEALQAAQLALLHHPDRAKWHAPAHWAAFALRGLP